MKINEISIGGGNTEWKFHFETGSKNKQAGSAVFVQMHAHINRAAWLEHNNVVGNINENVLCVASREGEAGSLHANPRLFAVVFRE